ncbi:MAG: HPr(Ser) kinase/phosphatase [Atopococcus tabaci]|uniref:HPr kinase/phosphorylase n=1 Tax=Atopococcus tabaci TaxID=269774 RepID=A0AA43UCE6_9LACT|nr:HPr(Ser) kinase/phosphatase [Atopococcus tabaci]
MVHTISVRQLLKILDDIHVLYGHEYINKEIITDDIYRPALELAGYLKYYPKERLQLYGKTEISYSRTMTSENRDEIFDFLCQKETPAFLISRGLEPPKELIEHTQKAGIPILTSERRTTQLSSRVTNVLERELAQRKSIHGVLLDVNGMGVLITGQSGIGKSETALDLIRRGHRLVTDDRVDLYTTDGVLVYGESPEVTKHMIEIRGIGIIDVTHMFGVGAVRERARVNLIVHLELWNEDTMYDRLGADVNHQKIFDVEIPSMVIPVSPGRNIAIIIETAAMSIRSKQLGYDASEKLMENMNRLMAENAKKNKNE